MRFVQIGKALCCALVLVGAGSTFAQATAPVQREVAHLLDYVARPDCQFNRNGIWHSGPEARKHLQQKYDYLAKRNQAPTAEAFIERAATSSSMSGTGYQVRCGREAATASGPWLTAELRRYRATGVTPTAK